MEFIARDILKFKSANGTNDLFFRELFESVNLHFILYHDLQMAIAVNTRK